MSEQPYNAAEEPPSVDMSQQRPESPIDEAFEAIEGGITGVPAPLRRNFWKAVGQLCTAAVDVPVAMLEGIAQEKRAETSARTKLIGQSATQLAEQMKVDPAYIRAAATKFTQKVVREQVNLDATTAVAYKELEKSPPLNGPVADISEDFLNAFEREASQVSTEQMQRLFGRILAGEVRRPSSFSIKTIKLISQLDNRAAMTFRRLCSICCSLQIEQHIIDARVVSLGGNAGSNALAPYQLSFDQLNILQEYGLIISDYNSYVSYSPCVVFKDQVQIPLYYMRRPTALRPRVPWEAFKEFRVHGVALSNSGKELLNVIDLEPDERYTAALKEFFGKQELDIVEVKVQPKNGS